MSQEQLTEIENLAALFFTPNEIATIIGISSQQEIDEFILLNESAKNAINTGRLKSEAEIRKSIFELAKQGSAPAQLLATKFIDQYHLRKI